VAAGAWGVRVHDVRANVDAIKVWLATRGFATRDLATRGTG
ncbi:MAG: dihydropteroate synthase, partial [Micromonosporaceae bacterium]|nr:dihydropteroate synthase [Micromonosporaceae bacterium]